MMFWLMLKNKVQLKAVWTAFRMNRYKWKLPFLFLTREFLRLIKIDFFRTVSGIVISVAIHSVAILFYVGMEHLDNPIELPIREISFLDMTEEPAQTKPPIKNVQKNVNRPFKLERNKNLTANSMPSVNQKIKAAGSDNLFLDSERNQAPIKFAKIEPVAGNKLTPNDVIKISSAKGLRKDGEIKRPAPINLDKNKSLVLASNFRPNEMKNYNEHDSAPINLNKRLVRNQQEVKGIKLNAVPPAINLDKTSLNNAKTRTFISGPLANRKILKKIIPPFPLWAKRAGVGATISLRFTVMENGAVKENVIVERTSGSSDWDHLVVQSLKKWKFVALGNSGIRSAQTGVITFQFVI